MPLPPSATNAAQRSAVDKSTSKIPLLLSLSLSLVLDARLQSSLIDFESSRVELHILCCCCWRTLLQCDDDDDATAFPDFPHPFFYLTTRNKTQNDTTLLRDATRHDTTRHDAMRYDAMRHSHCEGYDVVQSVNLNKAQTNTTVPIRIRIPTRSFINDELHIIGVWQQQQQQQRQRHQTRVLSYCLSIVLSVLLRTSAKQ